MNPTREITLRVNGNTVRAVCETRITLLDFLRDQAGLTGTHAGCEHGVCGACTVQLDGESVRSCLLFAAQVSTGEITTVEGLAPAGSLTDLQRAFRRHHALQCGFCTPGMLMTADALLRESPNPDEAAVRAALSGNLCRCTGYQPIIEAVLDCAESRAEATLRADQRHAPTASGGAA